MRGFPCVFCGTEASFLIRGLCERCAPEIHHAHAEALARFQAADEMFWCATGQHALQEWYGFETFVHQHIDQDARFE
jgi:hypothetical protein